MYRSSDYFEGGMVTYQQRSKAKAFRIPLDYIKSTSGESQVRERWLKESEKRWYEFWLSITGVADPQAETKRSSHWESF